MTEPRPVSLKPVNIPMKHVDPLKSLHPFLIRKPLSEDEQKQAERFERMQTKMRNELDEKKRQTLDEFVERLQYLVHKSHDKQHKKYGRINYGGLWATGTLKITFTKQYARIDHSEYTYPRSLCFIDLKTGDLFVPGSDHNSTINRKTAKSRFSVFEAGWKGALEKEWNALTCSFKFLGKARGKELERKNPVWERSKAQIQ